MLNYEKYMKIIKDWEFKINEKWFNIWLKEKSKFLKKNKEEFESFQKILYVLQLLHLFRLVFQNLKIFDNIDIIICEESEFKKKVSNILYKNNFFIRDEIIKEYWKLNDNEKEFVKMLFHIWYYSKKWEVFDIVWRIDDFFCSLWYEYWGYELYLRVWDYMQNNFIMRFWRKWLLKLEKLLYEKRNFNFMTRTKFNFWWSFYNKRSFFNKFLNKTNIFFTNHLLPLLYLTNYNKNLLNSFPIISNLLLLEYESYINLYNGLLNDVLKDKNKKNFKENMLKKYYNFLNLKKSKDLSKWIFESWNVWEIWKLNFEWFINKIEESTIKIKTKINNDYEKKLINLIFENEFFSFYERNIDIDNDKIKIEKIFFENFFVDYDTIDFKKF